MPSVDSGSRREKAKAPVPAQRICVAGGVGVDAAELDDDGGAQRRTDGVGVRDGSGRVEMGLFAALGSVVMAGSRDIAWPSLGRQPLYRVMGRGWKEASRLAMIGLGLLWLTQQLPEPETHSPYGLSGMGMGSVVSKPLIEVEQDAEGVYHVRLSGEFELHVNGKIGGMVWRITIEHPSMVQVLVESRLATITEPEGGQSADARGATLPRFCPSVVCRCFPGACPQCVTLADAALPIFDDCAIIKRRAQIE